MPISNSPLAYSDCYEAMTRALEDSRGVRLRVDSKSNAEFLRMRLNQARALNRTENARTYEKDHPMHGRSEYDKLMFRIREVRGKEPETRVYVYLEKVEAFSVSIEDLSKVDGNGDAEVKTKPTPIQVQSLTIKKEESTIPMFTRRF